MRLSLGMFLLLLGASCAHARRETARMEEPHPQQAASAPAPRPAADPQELSRLADLAYKELDFPACAEHFRQAAEAHTDQVARADSFYGAACCAALAGDHARALELLERSVQSGYVAVDYLQADPELFPLHSLDGWQAVVAGAQANWEKAPSKPRPVPVLAAVDVYGSRRAEPEAVRRMLGFEIGKPIALSSVLVKKQEEALRKRYNLAFAKVSFVSYFAGPEANRAYLTVDLVDAEDAKRAEFLPAPSGQTQDPEGLVSQWLAYEQKAWQLLNRGELDPMKHSVCRVAHCALGFGHPELAPFEPPFVEKVPAAQDAVAQVLHRDADERKRAAAAYLLAYAASSEQAVQRLLPSIRDPSYLVRNNVLRVLMDIQRKADRPLVEVAVVVDALSMPTTTDRNKGLYLLKALLEKMKPEELKGWRAPLTRQLGAQLVELAALQQPNNRDPARDVLKLISGEKYETPEQWKSWLAREREKDAKSPSGTLLPRSPGPEGSGWGADGDGRMPDASDGRAGRIVLGTLGGLLLGTLATAPGILIMADSFSCSTCVDDAEVIGGGLISLAGLTAGGALGVKLAGSLLGGEGRYLHTLLGAGLGFVAGLLGALPLYETEGGWAVPVFTFPLIGAVIGYEVSHSKELQRQAATGPSVSVLPSLSVQPSGGIVAGLVGRF